MLDDLKKGSATLASFFFGLAFLFLLAWALLPFFFRTAGEDEASPYPPHYGPWAVNGVRLGMTLDECVRVLGGPPKDVRSGYGVEVKTWPGPGVTVTFDAPSGGRARDILGRDLTDRSGKTVVWKSASEADVRAILKTARVKRHYRPKGSGVISIGMANAGASYTCEDPEGKYAVELDENGFVKYVRAYK